MYDRWFARHTHSLVGKRVAVCGATGGIGSEFARSFGSRGFDLVLVGRNADTLEELKEELQK